MRRENYKDWWKLPSFDIINLHILKSTVNNLSYNNQIIDYYHGAFPMKTTDITGSTLVAIYSFCTAYCSDMSVIINVKVYSGPIYYDQTSLAYLETFVQSQPILM